MNEKEAQAKYEGQTVRHRNTLAEYRVWNVYRSGLWANFAIEASLSPKLQGNGYYGQKNRATLDDLEDNYDIVRD
jgi:hypothetical protein